MSFRLIRMMLLRIYVVRVLSDYLVYTFTTATAIVLVTGALIALTAIVVFALDEPVLIVAIFSVYLGIFLTAMAAGLVGFLKYRKFPKSEYK